MLSGLSPLVRGKRGNDGTSQDGIGSIPACAGETSPDHIWSRSSRVYPLLCGGNLPSGREIVYREGLSPLVRGKLIDAVGVARDVGSIPACAGETIPYSSRISSRRVYPRLCGGNACSSVPRRIAEGLSPLVRGKLPRNGFFRIF